MLIVLPSGQLNVFLGGSTNMDLISSNVVPLNQWVPIAVTRTSNVFRLFIHGVLTATSRVVTQSLEDAATIISRDLFNTPRDFSGCIDDLVILNGASLYDATFTVSTLEFSKYIPALNPQLRFELESVRDGLTSYQKHNITVVRS